MGYGGMEPNSRFVLRFRCHNYTTLVVADDLIQRGMDKLILQPALSEDVAPPVLATPVVGPAAPEDVAAVNAALSDLEELVVEEESEEDSELSEDSMEEREQAQPDPVIPNICISCERPLRAATGFPFDIKWRVVKNC